LRHRAFPIALVPHRPFSSRLRLAWHEIEPSDEIRETAKRLLRVHELRPTDVLQLAAAVFVSEARPSTLKFISLDERLLADARREGCDTNKQVV
jgi:hypothetical protein